MRVDRPELGILLHRLMRVVLAREQAILDESDLGMWDYAVLAALGGGEAPSQAQLSAATGRDKTRLIGNLDRLETMGLVRREPDRADRRHRIVSLTPRGTEVLTRCRESIRSMEEDLLAGLPADVRRGFERALVELAPEARPDPGS